MRRDVGDVELRSGRGGYANKVVEQVSILGDDQWAVHRGLPVVREAQHAEDRDGRAEVNGILWTAGSSAAEPVENLEKGRPPPGGRAGVAYRSGSGGVEPVPL
ncbi:hypothetical protein GCM10012278_59650 [Nonomuraea glycinis]|uniref:Uncharacterized protein n=1 Tax=Nonomuraea glycinis TaxID=2047744 RepID=A0A918AAL7_9ACTN|nr:hypothetical protein GCM10012278_59650 [Nonomuraea glycinis]